MPGAKSPIWKTDLKARTLTEHIQQAVQALQAIQIQAIQERQQNSQKGRQPRAMTSLDTTRHADKIAHPFL